MHLLLQLYQKCIVYSYIVQLPIYFQNNFICISAYVAVARVHFTPKLQLHVPTRSTRRMEEGSSTILLIEEAHHTCRQWRLVSVRERVCVLACPWSVVFNDCSQLCDNVIVPARFSKKSVCCSRMFLLSDWKCMCWSERWTVFRPTFCIHSCF